MTTERPSPAPATTDEPFYVGYLPMPDGYRHFLTRLVVTLGLGVLAVAGAMAWFQRDPAQGAPYHGSAKEVRELSGILHSAPYGVLRAPGEAPGQPARTLILTTNGKQGVADLVTGKDGHAVTMRGVLRGRSGRYVFAMDTKFGFAEASLDRAQRARLTRPQAEPVGSEPVSLRGEIIDPKCFTGAMKPGNGKAHKACAINCLQGGIPPMFATRADDGHESFYLLVDESGGPILDPLIPWVGDPVEIRGRVYRQADMMILRVQAGSIQRL